MIYATLLASVPSLLISNAHVSTRVAHHACVQPSVHMCAQPAPPKLDFMKLLDGEDVTKSPAPVAPTAVAPPPPPPAATAPASAPAASDGVTVKVKRPTAKKPTTSKQPHDDGAAGYMAVLAALDGSEPAPAAPAITPESGDGVASWYDRGVRLDGSSAPAEELNVLQCTISEWEAADVEQTKALKEQVAKLEADFDKTQEAPAVKEQLLGTWKLVLAPRADKLRAQGLAAKSASKHSRVVGHFQTFRKPDPMDILSGNAKKPFMETTEVSINVVDGSSSSTSLYGGFTVGALQSGGVDVVEYHASRADAKLGAAAVSTPDEIAPNSWVCAHVGPMYRVCKLVDGSSRVYVRVDEAEAKAEISRLGGLPVAVDAAAKAAAAAAAAAAAKATQAVDPMDDPNDTRPMWQKRIDKEDGVKRTKNGTPIINHGPIGGGGGGPKLQ